MGLVDCSYEVGRIDGWTGRVARTNIEIDVWDGGSVYDILCDYGQFLLITSCGVEPTLRRMRLRNDTGLLILRRGDSLLHHRGIVRQSTSGREFLVRMLGTTCYRTSSQQTSAKSRDQTHVFVVTE